MQAPFFLLGKLSYEDEMPGNAAAHWIIQTTGDTLENEVDPESLGTAEESSAKLYPRVSKVSKKAWTKFSSCLCREQE